jgi:hypothetical protein
MVKIGDTLIEDRTTRVNTDIGTGQTVLLPSALMSTLDGTSALGNTRRERGSQGAN